MSGNDNDDLFGDPNKVNHGDDNTDPNNVENPLEELVGEDKKFKTAEELARGKLESDKYIERLLKEKREMEEELGTRLNMEQYLKELDQKLGNLKENGGPSSNSKPAGGENGSAKESNSDGAKGLTPEDFDSLLEQRLRQREAETRVKENRQKVIAEAKRIYGESYQDHLAALAAKHNYDQAFLNEVADKNPTAFFRMLGVDQEAVVDSTDSYPRGNSVGSTVSGGAGVNTDAMARTNSRRNVPKMSDFSKMRREDPKRYFSAPVQKQMFELTKEYGEDFLNN